MKNEIDRVNRTLIIKLAGMAIGMTIGLAVGNKNS